MMLTFGLSRQNVYGDWITIRALSYKSWPTSGKDWIVADLWTSPNRTRPLGKTELRAKNKLLIEAQGTKRPNDQASAAGAHQPQVSKSWRLRPSAANCCWGCARLVATEQRRINQQRAIGRGVRRPADTRRARLRRTTARRAKHTPNFPHVRQNQCSPHAAHRRAFSRSLASKT